MDPLHAMMRATARRVLGEGYDLERITTEKTFEELGIDSLYLTEIAYGVLARLDLYVPMGRIAETRTVGGFLALIAAEAAQAGVKVSEEVASSEQQAASSKQQARG